MLTFSPQRPTSVPLMLTTPPNGMIAKAAIAVRIEIAGASAISLATPVSG